MTWQKEAPAPHVIRLQTKKMKRRNTTVQQELGVMSLQNQPYKVQELAQESDVCMVRIEVRRLIISQVPAWKLSRHELAQDQELQQLGIQKLAWSEFQVSSEVRSQLSSQKRAQKLNLTDLVTLQGVIITDLATATGCYNN